MDSLVQPCYSQHLPGCLHLPSMFSQGHTATLHLPNGRIVNLVSNVLRKHDSNRPYALPRFWKSHIDIEIIQSKFVWICYIDIHQYKAENLRRKRPNSWICTFESSRKSICFRNQLSGLDFKKTWKFTCISSRRKDSGNVTGKIRKNSGDARSRWKVKMFWDSEWIGNIRNQLIDHSSLDATTAKEGQITWKHNSFETLSNGVQTYLFDMCHTHRLKRQRNIAIIWISIVESPLDQYEFTSSILYYIQRSVQLFQPKHA